jgi:hypothetical protein
VQVASSNLVLLKSISLIVSVHDDILGTLKSSTMYMRHRNNGPKSFFECKYSPKISIFFIAYFLLKILKLICFVLKLHTQLATVTNLLKYDKFGLNVVSIKQNLPNSTILPAKNGAFVIQ